jgi:formylglycine-generating enzyme required for sulfatase activity
MGSPETEIGRYDDEGPQHEVTIAQGFWMFETPCTQALWEVVMGDNPSEFPSPDRPVERVAWMDCQKFVERLNARLEGLELSLPSEAQWEYACRAGTQTTTYAGDLRIRSVNDAPVLDPIAWYGGNCSEGFDLANGWGVWADPESMAESARGGTHPVGLKLANAWGLRDMLGNVWEWCADESDQQGKTETEDSPTYMIRGGSWHAPAKDVRVARRDWILPFFREPQVGVRFAQFREGVIKTN